MRITIKVFGVTDGDAAVAKTPPRELIQALGFLPSGQLFIASRVREGRHPLIQSAAVREITAWLREHRPGWPVTFDGPCVQDTVDARREGAA